jgi:hypothetical protein
VVAAVAMTLAWFLGELALTSLLMARMITKTGSGGLGAVSMTTYAPFAGMVAFVVGSYLSFRWLKRRVPMR